MRGLAEFIMRSPNHAAGVAFVACMVAYFSMLGPVAILALVLSSATVALVVLRRGWQAGSLVLFWGLLPAIGLVFYQHDFSALAMLVGTCFIAVILRSSVSWATTLLSSVVVGIFIMLLFMLFQAAVLETDVERLKGMLNQAGFYKQLNESATGLAAEQVNALLIQIVAGANARLYQSLAVIALILARWWQSTLYVPEGFQKEFFQLKLSPKLVASILVLIVIALNINVSFVALLPIVMTPLFFAGLAMFHSIIATQSKSSLGLMVFYLVQVIFAPIMFPLTVLVALLDSFIDFRGRMTKPVS